MPAVLDLSCSLPVSGSWFINIDFEFVAERMLCGPHHVLEDGWISKVLLHLTLNVWYLVNMTVSPAWHSFRY